MTARHAAVALLLALGIAQSCTNDFGKFDLTGDTGDGDSADDGESGAPSGSGGTTATGGVISGGTGGTIPAGGANTGGTNTGGRAGTSGTAGASGDAGAAGGEGCSTRGKDCGGSCVPVDDPATGCAATDSCEPCAFDNATASCAAGECGLGNCDSDWGDCNLVATDGCEQTLADTVVHCGGCDRACATGGVASVECREGLCASSCALGFANCATPPAGQDDGCETATSSNAMRCGSCNNDCTAQGLALCTGSVCGCGSQGECGNGAGVGCAEGLCSCDATSCRPGERCRQAGGDRLCACNGGAACSASEVCCETPAGCTDINASPTSCGACGRACTTGFVCEAGRCACDSDEDCDAGMSGDGGEGGMSPTGPTCVSGACVCGTNVCAEGQRCLATGSCG